MRKVFIWFFVVLAIALVAGAAVFMFVNRSASTAQTTIPSTVGTGTSQAANVLVPVYSAPSSTTITIGTPSGLVTVNNFYKTALGAEEQFVVLAQGQDYEITYNVNTSSFYINVLQTPFDAGRAAGEAGLLQILGVTRADACKLDVTEGAAGNTSGKIFLSFCGASASSTFAQ
ncbi:MAG: hypothetical protein P4M10_07965 [Verrucomicrobiae bacterium]|nr:hypothetical protein [Verrucomicrobiae bacterium]